MDARIHPYVLLDLKRGDAHLIRNAGGLATDDAIRSLALSQHLLGTREIKVIHHTNCGLSQTTDGEFADLLEQFSGKRPGWSAGTFSSLDDLMAETLTRLRNCPFLKHKDKISGYVYDVHERVLTQTDG